MSKQTDVIVVGGGPAGVITAITARKYYPDKKVMLIRDKEKGVIPCGIPYVIASLESPEQNILSYAPLKENNIEAVIDEVTKIELKDKTVQTKKGDTYSYEKLVLATGSSPVLLPIPGTDKKGIYFIHKDMKYLEELEENIKKSKNILVLGGGFIGIEFADEISKLNKNTYIVEMFPKLLANSFDEEFADLAEEKLKSKDVNVLTGIKVEEFIGNEKVEKVRLSNGKTIEVDLVISAVGGVPNTKLAQNAGLDLGKGKGIWTDEYMRTIDPDIFAVGDCAGKRDFFTRKDNPVMLASVATSEARIAGANLYQLNIIRENKGVIGIYSTYIDGLVLGSAGLTEITAKKEGFQVVTGNFEGMDKHPGKLPGANKIKVKLIFAKHSGMLMGGQVAGGASCGELINAIGISVQKRVSFSELETLQMATHPYLTSAPTMYPLVIASQDVAIKLRKK